METDSDELFFDAADFDSFEEDLEEADALDEAFLLFEDDVDDDFEDEDFFDAADADFEDEDFFDAADADFLEEAAELALLELAEALSFAVLDVASPDEADAAEEVEAIDNAAAPSEPELELTVA